MSVQDEQLQNEETLECTPSAEPMQDAAEETVAEVVDFTQEWQAALDEAQAKATEYYAMAQRIQAEFENYKKRNSAIAAQSYEDGTINAIKAFLPVLDNFDRALESGAEATPFYQGMENVHKQMLDVLDRLNIEEIPTQGLFDPQLHEAVLRDESEGTSGEVSKVFQKGYRVKGGRIIRFAMVSVFA